MECEHDWTTVIRVEFADEGGIWKMGSHPKLTLIKLLTSHAIRFPWKPLLDTACEIILGLTTVDQTDGVSTSFQSFGQCDITEESPTVIGHVGHK